MSWMVWLSIGLCGGVVVAYAAYTLLEWGWLRVLVNAPTRPLLLGAGMGAAVCTWLPGFASTPVALGCLAWAAVCFAYVWRRQWLFPRQAVELLATTQHVDDEELLVVLADGRATALNELEVARTARFASGDGFGEVVVVHCGLSRATAAFEPVAGVKMKAWLPHKSGFYVGDGGDLWDGVDGGRLSNGEALKRLPVVLCSAAVWRAQWSAAQLWAQQPPVQTKRSTRAVTKSARGVADGTRWGVVQAGVWRPLRDDELRNGIAAEETNADYYLARWAALARGLPF